MAPNRSRCAPASLNSSQNRNQRNEGTNLASKTYKSRVRILCSKSTPFESYAKSGKTLTLARGRTRGRSWSRRRDRRDEAIDIKEPVGRSPRAWGGEEQEWQNLSDRGLCRNQLRFRPPSPHEAISFSRPLRRPSLRSPRPSLFSLRSHSTQASTPSFSNPLFSLVFFFWCCCWPYMSFRWMELHCSSLGFGCCLIAF